MNLFRKRQYHLNKTLYHAYVPSMDSFVKGIIWDHSLTNLVSETESALTKLFQYSELAKDMNSFQDFFLSIEVANSLSLDGLRLTVEDAYLANLGSIDMNDETKIFWNIYHNLKKDLKEIPKLEHFNGEHMKQFARHATGDTTLNAYRSKQIWINGKSIDDAEFIPANPKDIELAMEQFFSFISTIGKYPKSITISIAFAFFFLVLPFQAQNARISRYLLQLLIKYQWKSEHFIFPFSLFLARDTKECNRQIMNIALKDDISSFLIYFLNLIKSSAVLSLEKAKELQLFQNVLPNKVKSTKRGQIASDKLLHLLPSEPYISVKRVEEITGLAKPNANILVSKFSKTGIIKLVGNSKRNRIFYAKGYYDIMT